MLTGTCNCGAVGFEVHGTPKNATVCHCGQCRKQSGNTWASAAVKQAELRMTEDTGLKWYAASDIAQRGFCGTCGAFLFWKHNDEDTISFSLGSLDAPTGLKMQKHIFVADKGDYYDIADDLPQEQQ